MCCAATIHFSCKCKDLLPFHCRRDNDAMCQGEAIILLIRYFSLLHPCQSCHERGWKARDEARIASTNDKLANLARAVETSSISSRAWGRLARAVTARFKCLQRRAVREKRLEQENIEMLKNWASCHAYTVLKMHFGYNRVICYGELHCLQAREPPMFAARINRELEIASDVEAFAGPWHRVGNEWRQRRGTPGMSLDIKTTPAEILEIAGLGSDKKLASSPPMSCVRKDNSMGPPPMPRSRLP